MKVLKIEASEKDDNQYIATVVASKEEVVALFGGAAAKPAPAAETKPAATAPASTSNGAANGATKAATSTPAKPAEKPAEKPKVAAATTEKPKAAAAAKPAEKPAPKAEEKPALELVGGDEDEPAVGDEPPAEEADDAAFSLDGEVPEELMTAGRLLTVVSFLFGRGFHTVEAITAACNKLKDKVPLLKDNANFAERIPVAFAALPQA